MPTGSPWSIPRIARSIPRRWKTIVSAPVWPSGWNSAPGRQNGPYRWLELRATIVTEQEVPSDCLGLISDISQRKEAEFAAVQAEAQRQQSTKTSRMP